MTDFVPINKEKAIKKLESALKYYGLDQEYSIEKIRDRMSKSNRHGFGELVSEIGSKVRVNSIDEMNKLLELLSAFGNISPNLELGGLSPQEMVKWHNYQKVEKVQDEKYVGTKLLKDTINFLSYIGDNKIILTQTLKELKRKDIYNLNSMLVTPDEIDHELGGKIYKLRCENEARTVHFLKFLTDVAGLIKQRLNKITITKKGEKFLLLSPSEQFSILFETWLYRLRWSCLQYFDEDFIDSMQAESVVTLYRLTVLLDLKNKVSAGDFHKQILAMLEIPTEQSEAHLLSFTTERTILARLEYFGLLCCVKELRVKSLSYRLRSENNEYSLTEFGRKYLINFILRDASNFANR